MKIIPLVVLDFGPARTLNPMSKVNEDSEMTRMENQAKSLNPVNICFRNEAEIKTFSGEGKLREFFISRAMLCLKEILET